MEKIFMRGNKKVNSTVTDEIKSINQKYSKKYNQLMKEYTNEVLDLLKNTPEVKDVVENPQKKSKDLNDIFNEIGSWF